MATTSIVSSGVLSVKRRYKQLLWDTRELFKTQVGLWRTIPFLSWKALHVEYEDCDFFSSTHLFKAAHCGLWPVSVTETWEALGFIDCATGEILDTSGSGRGISDRALGRIIPYLEKTDPFNISIKLEELAKSRAKKTHNVCLPTPPEIYVRIGGMPTSIETLLVMSDLGR